MIICKGKYELKADEHKFDHTIGNSEEESEKGRGRNNILFKSAMLPQPLLIVLVFHVRCN